MPLWKTVACPVCKSQAGEPCGQMKKTVTWFIRCAPHADRKRLATGSLGAKKGQW